MVLSRHSKKNELNNYQYFDVKTQGHSPQENFNDGITLILTFDDLLKLPVAPKDPIPIMKRSGHS